MEQSAKSASENHAQTTVVLTTPSAKAVGHSPLPWRKEKAINGKVHLYANEGREGYPLFVLNATATSRTQTEIEVNYDLIVRACNSHYQLLSALKAIRSDAQHFLVAGGDLETIAQEVLLKAEQAISEAESEAAHG